MNIQRLIARTLRRLGFRPAPQPTAGEAAARHWVLADHARDLRDWGAAAREYALALAYRPDEPALLVQRGHALSALGHRQEAEEAYAAAVRAAPDDPDPLLHLGRLLKARGSPVKAIDAFARAAALDPDLPDPRLELLHLGARHRLPSAGHGMPALAGRLDGLAGALEQVAEARRQFVEAATFPAESYDRFRRTFPTTPPPDACSDATPIDVRLDARDATDAAVRVTLDSLIDQTDQRWRCHIQAPHLIDRPVAGLLRGDERFTFDPASPVPGSATLLVPAGACLDPFALAWLRWARARTGALVVYADHDSGLADWRWGVQRSSPALFGAPDPIDLATTPAVPLVVLIKGDLLAEHEGADDEGRRAALMRAIEHGPAAHVPKVLATDLRPRGPTPQTPSRSGASPAPTRIAVIIPTRDQGGLLEAALTSLRAKASGRHAVEYLIVDNGSTEAATLDVLNQQAAADDLRVVKQPQPFNWSQLNNAASRETSAPLLVFANNDIEMLTEGWDDVLASYFGDPSVGVVGGRMLYPDGSLQHVGISFGGDGGRPVHEGRGEAGRAAGPLSRWMRPRQAAAVTGAFLAVPARVFDDAGGFDDGLAIAYNDIDFCLRVRALDRKVVYTPQIEMIHHESKSRGQNDDDAKIAWDDLELSRLHARWGDDLLTDPGISPCWQPGPTRRFDAFFTPPLSVTREHVDRGARLWRTGPRRDNR